MTFTIRWMPWNTPIRESFKTDEEYFEYRDKVTRCEICGQVLQEGEMWGIIPHQGELGSDKKFLECRLVHRSCYRKEQR